MKPSRRERRLRNVQSLILVGSMFGVVALAGLAGWLGAPQWAVLPFVGIGYLVCWQVTLRAVRRRRALWNDHAERSPTGTATETDG
ncbi:MULTISPECIES: hypothetical protein [unclassified Curtobacterium]|uniref:hypothetical protein n=1 Tax=unclassified Curtobacterium TaxID=257496 RepID=UPI0015F45E13|nr:MULTISPECIES: hypothetical protein [unclassified Curtobacterium]MDT0232529.1 hypothetical protein [Curtobacterium sp. BRB10]